MTDIEKIEELEALASSATPGPWRFSRENWNVQTPDMSTDIAVYRPESEDDMTGEFIAAADPTTILVLLAELRRLNGIVEKYVDPAQVRLTGMRPAEDGLHIGLEGGACRIFAGAFAEQFRKSAGPNFIEMRFDTGDDEIGELLVTLQRVKGKTPAALKREAEVERDALRQQNVLLRSLEEAIRHDRAMYEGTSDEFNPTGTLVTRALAHLDAARAQARHAQYANAGIVGHVHCPPGTLRGPDAYASATGPEAAQPARPQDRSLL